MKCPSFQQLLQDQPDAVAHAQACAKCTQALAAIAVVRSPPRGSAEFQRQVMARLREKKRISPLVWLAPVMAISCVLILWQQPEFTARGGTSGPVVVEAVAQGAGYAVRVKNTLDHDIYVGSYLRDSLGETHWLAPHYPAGTPAPELVRVPAHTALHMLDDGVIPEAPAKGKAELVGFATDTLGRIESEALHPFFEVHTTTEVH